MKLDLTYLIILASAALVRGEIPRKAQETCHNYVRWYKLLIKLISFGNGNDIGNSINADKFENLARAMWTRIRV